MIWLLLSGCGSIALCLTLSFVEVERLQGVRMETWYIWLLCIVLSFILGIPYLQFVWRRYQRERHEILIGSIVDRQEDTIVVRASGRDYQVRVAEGTDRDEYMEGLLIELWRKRGSMEDYVIVPIFYNLYFPPRET